MGRTARATRTWVRGRAHATRSWGPAVRRRRGERGAALVEFALVLPLLLVVVLGIIDFGIAFANYESVRSGTREAARLGVVNDLTNAPSCTINGAVVAPPANPTTSTDATNALVCLTKERIGLSSAQTKVKLTVTGQAVGDDLDVCASFPVSQISGYSAPFLSGKIITSTVTMRLEQAPLFASYTEPGGAC